MMSLPITKYSPDLRSIAGKKPWNRSVAMSQEKVRVALLGDVHGEFRAVEDGMHRIQKPVGGQLNYVLQVGDAETIRDQRDLASVVGPAHKRQLGDYSAYHSRDRRLPQELFFIGGNHEAHLHLEEQTHLSDGPTEISPGFSYLGRVGVFEKDGVRIGGVSGIYSEEWFDKERPNIAEVETDFEPFTYFTREDIELAKKLLVGVHVLLVHDWPAGLADLVDHRTLRGQAPNRLGERGNDPIRELLELIRPDLLVCGHHHLFFGGKILWDDGKITEVVCLEDFNPDRGMDSKNTVVIEMQPDSLRVLYGDNQKTLTPELVQEAKLIPESDRAGLRMNVSVSATVTVADTLAHFGSIFCEANESGFFLFKGLKFKFSSENFEHSLEFDKNDPQKALLQFYIEPILTNYPFPAAKLTKVLRELFALLNENGYDVHLNNQLIEDLIS